MANSYTIAAGQKDFPKVVSRSEQGDPVPIERHGKTVAYVISKDRFDAVLETLELLSNADFVETLSTHKRGKLRMKAMAGSRK